MDVFEVEAGVPFFPFNRLDLLPLTDKAKGLGTDVDFKFDVEPEPPVVVALLLPPVKPILLLFASSPAIPLSPEIELVGPEPTLSSF